MKKECARLDTMRSGWWRQKAGGTTMWTGGIWKQNEWMDRYNPKIRDFIRYAFCFIFGHGIRRGITRQVHFTLFSIIPLKNRYETETNFELKVMSYWSLFDLISLRNILLLQPAYIVKGTLTVSFRTYRSKRWIIKSLKKHIICRFRTGTTSTNRFRTGTSNRTFSNRNH